LLFAEFPGAVRAILQMLLELDRANEVELAVEIGLEQAFVTAARHVSPLDRAPHIVTIKYSHVAELAISFVLGTLNTPLIATAVVFTPVRNNQQGALATSCISHLNQSEINCIEQRRFSLSGPQHQSLVQFLRKSMLMSLQVS
jgi:hypothetical protein